MMGDGGWLGGLMCVYVCVCARVCCHKIRRENSNIHNVKTELLENSAERRHVRRVHVSVNGSLCSVLARQVFPLTSELRGGNRTRELAESERGREMNEIQGC